MRCGAAAEDQRSLLRTWRRPDASTTGKISAPEKTSSPSCQCEGEGSVKHDTYAHNSSMIVFSSTMTARIGWVCAHVKGAVFDGTKVVNIQRCIPVKGDNIRPMKATETVLESRLLASF